MNMLKEKILGFLNLEHTLARELSYIHTQLVTMNQRAHEVLGLLTRPQEHFVQVLIFGNTPCQPPATPVRRSDYDAVLEEYGGVRGVPDDAPYNRPVPQPILAPCSLADSAFVRDTHTFSIQPYKKIINPKIVIVCDTSKIRIESVVCANEHASLYMEAGPVCFHRGVIEPSNRITIHVSSRTR